MGAPPAPFVRFSRDRRGYESVYLVHVFGRPARPRILYWFRTPPGVKLGRLPFDDNVRKDLETQYPDVRFDWKRIAEAQPPPVSEGEVWRERRRAERSAKQARQAAKRERGEPDVAADGAETSPSDQTEVPEQGEAVAASSADVPTADEPSEDSPEESLRDGEPEPDGEPEEMIAGTTLRSGDDAETTSAPGGADLSAPTVEQSTPLQGEGGVVSRGRRRRRRRGGRGRQRPAGPGMSGAAPDGLPDSGTGPQRPEPEPQAPDPEIRAGEPSSGEEPAS